MSDRPSDTGTDQVERPRRGIPEIRRLIGRSGYLLQQLYIEFFLRQSRLRLLALGDVADGSDSNSALFNFQGA